VLLECPAEERQGSKDSLNSPNPRCRSSSPLPEVLRAPAGDGDEEEGWRAGDEQGLELASPLNARFHGLSWGEMWIMQGSLGGGEPAPCVSLQGWKKLRGQADWNAS
jgi:hypothetical protein